MREIERELSGRGAGGGGRNGGAIGIGRRAAISVPRGAAIGVGLARSAIHAGLGLAESALEGLGVETSLAPHMAHAVALQQKVSDIAAAGFIPGAGGQAGIQQDPAQIMREIRDAANGAAIATNEVGDGLREFVAKTGDLQLGREMLRDTSHLARATGSDFVQMSEASAEVANHLGDIPNKAQAVAAVMRVIAGQGKLGAVEIKDLARQMAKIAATAPSFEGSTTKVIGELGLIAQETKLRGGAASASQAATSVMRLSQDLVKGTTIQHWTGAGLSAFTDASKTKLRSPQELIMEALNWSKGNLQKLGTLFPNALSMRAVQGFATVYREAGGDNAAKLRAVADEFDRLRKAQLDETEVTRAFGAAMTTTQSRVQIANNRLDAMAASIQEALLPAVAALAPAFEALGPKIASLLGFVADKLGINTHEDDDAKAERRRTDQAQALETELRLAKAKSGPVGLLHGPGDLPIGTPTGAVDASHMGAVEQNARDLADQIAKAEIEHRTHQSDFDTHGGSVKGWGVFQSKGDNENRLRLEQVHLDQLKEQQAKQVTVLEQVRDAIREQNIILRKPDPPPVRTDSSGRMPAESEAPEHQ
jgi:hypothetical protein